MLQSLLTMHVVKREKNIPFPSSKTAEMYEKIRDISALFYTMIMISVSNASRAKISHSLSSRSQSEAT